jgi:hypothetical protein
MNERELCSEPGAPCERALAWVCSALGGGAAVVEVAVLAGGMSTAILPMHLGA